MRFSRIVVAAGMAGCALAHGDHSGGGGGGASQKPIVDDNATWMQKHMAGMYTSYSALSQDHH
jgi:hypothetical protein